MNINTGMRTLATLLTLNVAALIAQDSKPFFFTWPGYVSAQGKWYNTSGKREDQLVYKHAVEIQCRVEIKECAEVMAQIIGSEPQVNVQHYRIVEWNKNDIIAEDDSPICLTNRLFINFQ